MTDKFTPNQIEQIERARKKAICGKFNWSWDIFIYELTKPKWTPQVGEVFCYSIGGVDNYYKQAEGGYLDKTVRPPTPDEVPALKVAIESLRQTCGPATGLAYVQSSACNTLAKIKELLND